MPDVNKALQDAAYVAVGLGVIGFQKAQVRRRELARLVGEPDLQLVQPALDLVADGQQPLVDRLDEAGQLVQGVLQRGAAGRAVADQAE